MARRTLQVVVRTPHETVFEDEATSVRTPTETGQVGLRPGGEATVLSVEAGILRIRSKGRTRYVGTPGGLLRSDGRTVTVLTAWAVVGKRASDIVERLEEALAIPSSEMEARKALEKLEGRILNELRGGEAEHVARRRASQ